MALWLACGDDPSAQPGDAELTCDSTWQAVQLIILKNRGCTAAVCHGERTQSGGLDLRPEHAYDELVYEQAEAQLAPAELRVEPGDEGRSLLYLKVKAAREHTQLPPEAGAPMPIGRDPLSENELSALRLWIRAGAPETRVIEGTQRLLDCNFPQP